MNRDVAAGRAADRRLRGLVLGLGSLCAVPGTAHATTIVPVGPHDPYIPQASYSYSNYVTDSSPDLFINDRTSSNAAYHPISETTTGQRTYIISGSRTTFTSAATSSISDAHGGTVQASVQTTNFATHASAALYYYFTLIGPDAAFVPVTISGYATTQQASGPGNYGRAEAHLIVNYFDAANSAKAAWREDFSDPEQHAFSRTIDVKPNLTAGQGASSIYMVADARNGIGEDIDAIVPSDLSYYGGSASATIDPIISIADPALASLYTIRVGLTSVALSPVPLPAAAPLFGAALLGLGVIGYGRKRHKAAVA